MGKTKLKLKDSTSGTMKRGRKQEMGAKKETTLSHKNKVVSY